jgi:hypothetical protein
MARLRRRILQDESGGRQELAEEIAKIQRKARCVRRAAGLMALLTAFAVAGFGYPTILLENFPNRAPRIVLNLICALGVGSLISLLAFAGLGMVYRKKLGWREEARRQMVARLFEPPLVQADTAPLPSAPDRATGVGNEGAAQATTGDNGSPLNMESTATD